MKLKPFVRLSFPEPIWQVMVVRPPSVEGDLTPGNGQAGAEPKPLPASE